MCFIYLFIYFILFTYLFYFILFIYLFIYLFFNYEKRKKMELQPVCLSHEEWEG